MLSYDFGVLAVKELQPSSRLF